jgi:fibronectin type 3 domain-containing protein
MKLEKTMALGLASMLFAVSDSAAVDFGIDLLQNTTDPVEAGYTGFHVGDVAAGSVAPSITVNGVTATIAAGNKIASLTTPAEFTGWNARNRSPIIPDSGSFTHDALYANRIGSLQTATNAATGEGVGIYVKLEGLLANKAYIIQASGNDYSAGKLKNGSFYLWDAQNEVTVGGVTSGLVAIDNYSVSGTPSTVADNDIYSASGQFTATSEGSLVFKVTGNIDRNTLNGFYVTQVPDGINPPTNLIATTNGAKVDLDWSDDLSGTLAFYTVYRGANQGGPYTQVATNVPASNYTDTTVATGQTYYYVVTATNTVAFQTAYSNEASILVRIQAPTGLGRTQGDGVIHLDWDDNISGILDFYTVYRSETSGGPYTQVATNLTASNHSDTKAINGTTYYYVVTATDDVVPLESVNSAQVSGTPFAPVAGTALHAHLDGSVATSVTADGSAIVSLWADQTANAFNAASAGGVGTVLYPGSSQSNTGLDGVDFGFTDPPPARSTLAWFQPAQQGGWLNFNDGAAALPYGGFAVFAVVRPSAILAGINRDVVLSSIESKFALRYEAGRPRMHLGNSVLLGTTGAVAADETVVLAVNYNAVTGQLDLWDSESGLTSTMTVPAADFSHTTPIFLGGSANSDQYMKGFIGEVKVFRGAMTPAEFSTERSTLGFKWIGLQAPSGLIASTSNGSVTLDWNDQVADSYTVYRGTEPGFHSELAANVPTSSFIDNAVTAGATYYYVVTATKNGEVSSQSAELAVTVPIAGSILFAHLDGSSASGITADENKVVSLWSDLTANDRDASNTDGIGTVFYPSRESSESGLDGVEFGFTDFVAPATNAKSALLWFDAAGQDSWLNFNNTAGAKPYSGFAVFAVVHPNAILAGSNRDVVMGNTENHFSIRYEGGRPQVRLGNGNSATTTVLQGSTDAAKAGETLVIAVNYNAITGQLELWDSESGLTTTATREVGDFSSGQGFFLGGTVNPDQFMKGMIGEAKIYRGNMTPSEFSAQRSALVTKWIGASSGFSAWQLANGTTGGLDEDHDSDGVANGVEFFIHGPVANSSFTQLPGVTKDSGTGALSVTWIKADGYTGSFNADFFVETSDSLTGTWTNETGNVTVIGNEVKFTFPTPLGSRKFARLRVAGP